MVFFLVKSAKLLKELIFANAEGGVTESPTFGTHSDDDMEEIFSGKIGFAFAVGGAAEFGEFEEDTPIGNGADEKDERAMDSFSTTPKKPPSTKDETSCETPSNKSPKKKSTKSKKKETKECPNCRKKMRHRGRPQKSVESVVGSVRIKRY
jgi:hypothetical protein